MSQIPVSQAGTYLSIQIDGEEIDIVICYKHLALVIDEKFSPGPGENSVSQKNNETLDTRRYTNIVIIPLPCMAVTGAPQIRMTSA